MNQRQFKYPVLEVIQERWSPRAFSEQSVTVDEVYQLLEALRYAPSSSNEQPWRLIVGMKGKTRDLLRSSLNEGNREWADHAPVLIALCAQTMTSSGKPNRYAHFDVGAAWAFLALEATHLKLWVHAMGGFDRQKVHEDFKLSDTIEVLAVIAVGHQGQPHQLSEKLQAREMPNGRKSVEEILIHAEV